MIANRFIKTSSAWELLCEFCRRHFGSSWKYPAFALEFLVILFQNQEGGIWLCDDVLAAREPSLQFDDDGLLVDPEGSCTFCKEGVLTGRHFLLYRPELSGAWKSGGFVDHLLQVRSSSKVKRFGIAVRRDILLERELYVRSYTAAYLWGPKGISESKLNDPFFPEYPNGTVTVHKLDESESLESMFPLLRLEVMWSRRQGIKTVQMEEIVPEISFRNKHPDVIQNRYIHAIWNGEAFNHFDGAIKSYDKRYYQGRLDSDIKRYDGPKPEYRKLFRIDGLLSLVDWCDLVALFFEENSLVYEYLDSNVE